MEPSGRPHQPIPQDGRYDVVVSLGTDQHPFPRLLDWMEEYLSAHPEVSCLLQHGASRPSHLATSVPQRSREEMVEHCRRACAVIVPGEPGAVLGVRKLGMIPLVVPREVARGEHEDNHQVMFTDHMVRSGFVQRVHSATQLAALLDASLADPSALRTAPRPTHANAPLRELRRGGVFTRMFGRSANNPTPRHRSGSAV